MTFFLALCHHNPVHVEQYMYFIVFTVFNIKIYEQNFLLEVRVYNSVLCISLKLLWSVIINHIIHYSHCL